jgi:hypothetical protein
VQAAAQTKSKHRASRSATCMHPSIIHPSNILIIHVPVHAVHRDASDATAAAAAVTVGVGVAESAQRLRDPSALGGVKRDHDDSPRDVVDAADVVQLESVV